MLASIMAASGMAASFNATWSMVAAARFQPKQNGYVGLEKYTACDGLPHEQKRL